MSQSDRDSNSSSIMSGESRFTFKSTQELPDIGNIFRFPREYPYDVAFKLEVFLTANRGYGVRTHKPIRKGYDEKLRDFGLDLENRF